MAPAAPHTSIPPKLARHVQRYMRVIWTQPTAANQLLGAHLCGKEHRSQVPRHTLGLCPRRLSLHTDMTATCAPVLGFQTSINKPYRTLGMTQRSGPHEGGRRLGRTDCSPHEKYPKARCK